MIASFYRTISRDIFLSRIEVVAPNNIDWIQAEMDGKLPINPSGGLKSKGHPIGATGISMHVMAAMQARGDAGPLQIDGAEIAGVFNMGGSAVANYASILEAVR